MHIVYVQILAQMHNVQVILIFIDHLILCANKAIQEENATVQSEHVSALTVEMMRRERRRLVHILCFSH